MLGAQTTAPAMQGAGGMFGQTQAAPGGGLFGGTSAQPAQPGGGLFG